jgi:quercetin dioxygenase-like cupin family protein
MGMDGAAGKCIPVLLHPGGTRLVIFRIIAEGSCWVKTEDGQRLWLQEGDVIGFQHGHAHSMGAGKAAPRVPIAELFPRPP